ncbi:MAG: hypothetical protein C4520_19660 [Candidatus Abyssobacteria bacterium SURF_5]|jgi:hypothetical protein|uniref:Uncharacterized protein n=1 Tax=Abyssobacteria bacterium (strain SURF_5) TaxID=2093360 RepID=A0A3A4NBF9_ABYX5|nr:MAG: hypothetical protein C4520_19660 [Candidatus Abyssubacteria bacterium SURF_5]
MNTIEDVSSLVDEYRALLGDTETVSKEALEDVLVQEGDWTPRAAEHLLHLAKSYGSFMLRNALAISLALDIEDGELGF